MARLYSDDNRFQFVVDQLIGHPILPIGVSPGGHATYLKPELKALDACRAMDDALVETIKYLKGQKEKRTQDIAIEERISDLWITASRKVALLDPELAEALSFKGMGWLDNTIWDIAESRDINISIEDMQIARQKLGNILHIVSQRNDTMAWERAAIFTFGVVFIIILLGIALFLPDPTDFQYTVLRITLALAAAGIAALIPGFIEIKYKQAIRAGGAIAVFVIVYFFPPASLVSNPPAEVHAPTDPFKISIVSGTLAQLRVNSYTFPLSDIMTRDGSGDFIALLKQLPAPSLDIDQSIIFRIRDEKTINKVSGSPVEGGNMGVLIVPNSIVNTFGEQHLAFTYIRSQLPKD